MHKHPIHVVAVIAITIVTALAGADRASAAGAVNISACGTLSTFGTVYRLTTDLMSCGDCLVVANNQITIDLQGHAITSTCSGNGSAITDDGNGRDVIVVRNGSITGYEFGVLLDSSTRVSVLGITATDNATVGIAVGSRGLVKSCEVSGNRRGIVAGDRSQVQQCNAHNNNVGILTSGDNCLITMNTANSNAIGIAVSDGNRCTVSFNTASNNSNAGINAGVFAFAGSGHLVTGNVALGNVIDYRINCPSTVTNNDSTNGFPASYDLNGNGCQTSNNH